MDKKNKFQPNCNAKPTTSDAKKCQGSDAASSKLFPKASRKREPTGCGNYSKYDQPRRSNAQKTKVADKRPKPKGYYHDSTKESSKVVEDESAELGSVMVQGSKKQNLNHLLNFHYAPREAQGGWNNGRSTGFNNHYNRWLPPVQRHKYNKEQFLQANCQFVVTAGKNYSLYLNDPDALIDWNLIQQIRIFSSENFSCPICLCSPVAGKMTRCGHVYCWPCILHYLALSDKTWRKCPICYEAVHKTDLKSVVEITHKIFNAGDEVVFRLMRRDKGSLLAVPVDKIDDPPPETFLSVAENLKQQVFSKLLLAGPNDIVDIIESERAQLNVELLDDPKSPENCFIEQALEELTIREQQLCDLVNVNEDGQPMENAHDNNLENAIISSGEETEVNASGNNTTSKKFHYFYQAENGQNVYLHAMNIKMLEMQYGNLENCPRTISGKLIEKEVGSFTEELRCRMRYLCHLPVTCEFEVAEIELREPTLTREVFDAFKDQIKLRQKKREKKDREERKREKKIAEEENKRMGKFPTPKVHIESHRHFPEFLPDNLSAETSIPTPPGSAASSVASSPSSHSFEDLAAGVQVQQSDQGPSFAEMLRTSRSKSSVSWPTLGSDKNLSSKESSLDSEQRTVDPEMEEYSPPLYSQSLGDALAQALEKTELLTHENKTERSSKKKKRAKATVLFATNMARTC